MFELIHSGGPYSDQTSVYTVKLNKEYTVGEFIHEVTSNKLEWGHIGIYDGKSIFGDPSINYHDGQIIDEMPDKYLVMKVMSARAYGGWSRMDYLLCAENVEKEEGE